MALPNNGIEVLRPVFTRRNNKFFHNISLSQQGVEVQISKLCERIKRSLFTQVSMLCY